jgi:hypothetical protein
VIPGLASGATLFRPCRDFRREYPQLEIDVLTLLLAEALFEGLDAHFEGLVGGLLGVEVSAEELVFFLEALVVDLFAGVSVDPTPPPSAGPSNQVEA